MQNDRKTDHMFELAQRYQLPILLFAERSGGRPGDTDTTAIASLDVLTFASFARLCGTVPLVRIVFGRSLAGNAALAGCCDVLIATEGSNLRMDGPAMMKGGGSPPSRPISRADVGAGAQRGGGCARRRRRRGSRFGATVRVLLLGRDRRVALCGSAPGEGLIPEGRVRSYNVRRVVDTVADTGSVLELRPRFGVGIITALAGIEGESVGMLVNNPGHLGGAIDTDAADKAARLLATVQQVRLPVTSLCETPDSWSARNPKRWRP